MKVLKFRPIPKTHTTIVSQYRLLLLYAIMKGLTIDIGKVIEQEVRYYATKKQKSTALLFPSLTTRICKASSVKFIESDKRVKNEEALVVRTMERIIVELIFAATPEHLTTTKSLKATKFEKIL